MSKCTWQYSSILITSNVIMMGLVWIWEQQLTWHLKGGYGGQLRTNDTRCTMRLTRFSQQIIAIIIRLELELSIRPAECSVPAIIVLLSHKRGSFCFWGLFVRCFLLLQCLRVTVLKGQHNDFKWIITIEIFRSGKEGMFDGMFFLL